MQFGNRHTGGADKRHNHHASRGVRSERAAVAIVGDDEALLNALTFSIEVEGYRVLTFASAQALLDVASIPDAICLVADHRLPYLDGLNLIERLRARGMSAPAILTTTNPGKALRARCKSLRVVIVEKPLISDELSQTIRLSADQ